MQRMIILLAILLLSCPNTTGAEAITSADPAASDGSRYDVWTFSGNAGDAITIDMRTTAFDAYLILLDPNDVPVAVNDDVSAGTTDARISFTLAATGTWSVIANSLAPGGSGDYALSISCPGGAPAPRRRAVRRA
jgi:Bacterial pre-peptidase C-terminal domain